MARLVLCWATLLLLAAPATAAAPPPRPDARLGKEFDDFVTEVMKEYQVPGLGLAVVKDGKVILVKGYGFRDVEKKLPVTGRTLFAIGSITKSFTVSALGLLVDEKKLTWDTKVRDILPGFRLHEKLPADRFTVRDLVTHRSGLPRHDAVWYLTTTSREQLLDRLRHLEPTHDLRERYQYNNLMYTVAGLVVEKVSGKSWEDFTRERLLDPLGMSRTNLSVKYTPRSDDYALGYFERDGKVRRVPFRNIDPMGPAGSINSCVEEMVNYLRLHLDGGQWQGKTLLSRRNSEEMQAPQMVIPLDEQRFSLFARPGDASYGLGFTVSRHRGERVIAHGGAIDGFIASLSFLPDHRAGVVVLTNLGRTDPPNLAPAVITHQVYDRLFGGTGIDWRERGREQGRIIAKIVGARRDLLAKERKPDTKPTHPLAELAGKFENAAYGPLTVEAKGEELRLSFSAATLTARHYHYNTFIVTDTDDHPAAMLRDNLITFEVGKKGVIERVKVQTQLGVGEMVFARAAEKAEKK